MTVKMPKEVMLRLREAIFKKLDAANYLSQGRVENGRFMEQLAHDPEIGGKIAEYTGKERVKTYIKDAVINRYAKERTRPPTDLSANIESALGVTTTKIDGNHGRGIGLYRTTKATVVTSSGRLLKWESALRKLLEYLGKNRDRLIKQNSEVKLFLVLMSGGQKLASADRAFLERSLDAIGVKIIVL